MNVGEFSQRWIFPFVLFGWIFSAQSESALPLDDDPNRTMKQNGLRFLALGDSYSIGEGVEGSERWPDLLAGMLRADGIRVNEPVIIAKTGWTTDELLAAIEKENPAGTFDLVSLLIGVNNQYRGRDTGNYRSEFRALLLKAIAFAGGKSDRVVVLSIPDWGVTPFAEGRDRKHIARTIDLFNAVNKEESSAHHVHYVDITAFSRQAGNDASFLTTDGLHPSEKMYTQWAQEVLPVVLPHVVEHQKR